MTNALHTLRTVLMVAFIALAAVGVVGQARPAGALAGGTCTDAGCNFGDLKCFEPPGGGTCYGHIEAN